LHRDFTIAGGELTAKLSVKRHVINQLYRREIEQLFLQ
jgi:long-chain acyl-CoA synthetase